MTRNLALAMLYALQSERVKQIQTNHFHRSEVKAYSSQITIMLPSEAEVQIILDTWNDLKSETEYTVAVPSKGKKK